MKTLQHWNLKSAIQTNLSLILCLGHCCWRFRSFNSFAQFLDSAGKVVNMSVRCSQIMNYLTIFDRPPFIFGFSIQVVKEVGVKTRKQVFLMDASCKIRFFLLFLCSEDLLFQISCAPKRSLVQYLLYTNAKRSFVPNLSQISQPVWSMRGVLGGLLGSRSSLPPGCAMCICVLSKYHRFNFQVPLLTANPLQNWATPGRSSQREVLRRFSRRGASNRHKKRNRNNGWIKKSWEIFGKSWSNIIPHLGGRGWHGRFVKSTFLSPPPREELTFRRGQRRILYPYSDLIQIFGINRRFDKGGTKGVQYSLRL